MPRNTAKNLPLLAADDQVAMADMIAQRHSFRVRSEDWEQLLACCHWVEAHLDAVDLNSRVYTKGRVAAAAMGLFSVGAGMVVLAGIATHNLLTWNPDYEICRDLANQQLWVCYQG